MIWQTFVNGDLPYTYGSIVLKSSPAVVGGIVYVGSLDGYMYALDANNGNVIWTYQTQGQIESSPAVPTEQYISPRRNQLQALSTSWTLTLEVCFGNRNSLRVPVYRWQEMMGSPSVADGMVFASSDLRSYYGVNATTATFFGTSLTHKPWNSLFPHQSTSTGKSIS